MKFGKQIQRRQLDLPEYAASFVNYKALKKLIKQLSATPTIPAQSAAGEPQNVPEAQAALRANKEVFFFRLEREIEKVNAFYLQKEAEVWTLPDCAGRGLIRYSSRYGCGLWSIRRESFSRGL
jgi:CDK inhibitor PHO81